MPILYASLFIVRQAYSFAIPDIRRGNMNTSVGVA